MTPAPCPVCGQDGGFHDQKGAHRDARARIPKDSKGRRNGR